MIVDIDLVSDFVCPWCFLGKVRLAKAIEQVRESRPDLQVRLNWLPFFLNPDTPAAGEPYRAFLEAKFGGPKGADAVQAQVAEAAAGDGLVFAFDRIRTRPNTLKAHCLSYRLQSQGFRQEQVTTLAERLFAAHFQEGRDIGDSATLADIAAACGDRRDEAFDYLESGEGEVKVKAMAAKVIKLGVSGVPFFIINRKLAVSGAQTPATLGAAILQACA